MKHRLILANSFDAEAIKTTVRGNSDRFQFITEDESQTVLNACPDAQWRLIFALSRWGGLRCPSETLSLRWEHVDWANERLTIPQPKVVHHGTPERAIPIFPELRRYLEAAFDEAEPGTVEVITRYRKTTSNLRTQFQRIIKRAGLTPWPRLFHNLRATRQMELSDRHPQHVVCEWLGNSEKVATRHYLNVTDAHFRAALVPFPKPTQNPTQPASAGTCSDANPATCNERTPYIQGVIIKRMDDTGPEHTSNYGRNTATSTDTGAQSGARVTADGDVGGTGDSSSAVQASSSPLLTRLLNAWNRLSRVEQLGLVDDAEMLAERFMRP